MFRDKVIVHIVHAKYLSQRQRYYMPLISKLQETGLLESVIIHDKFDPDQINIPSNSNPHLSEMACFTSQPLDDKDPYAYFNAAIKGFAITQASNVLKHKDVLQSVASSTEPYLHLIIEDDILYSDTVVPHLKLAVEGYESGSILFLGTPSPSTGKPFEIRDVAQFYKVVPCCDSFLVDNTAAAKLLAAYDRIRFANHIQLTYAALKMQVPMKLTTPHIFIDGSKYGVVNSNLEINNRLVFNPSYNKLAKAIVALDGENPKRSSDIDAMFVAFDFKQNPELFFLKARYEAKLGNYVFAKALFAYTYKMYLSIGTPLTQGSEFMQEYMKLHKHFQCV
jgi:hypothetical protein